MRNTRKSWNDRWPWKVIKDVLRKVSEKVLGKAHRVNRPWFNTRCQKVLDRRKITKERWLNDVYNYEKERIFRVRRKEAHNIVYCSVLNMYLM